MAKYNASTGAWDCGNDLQGTGAGGTGTVTNIATGAGLSGGPITTTGTINLAASQLLPTTTCSDSQTLIWNSTTSKWICAAWNNVGFGTTLSGSSDFSGFRVDNNGAGGGIIGLTLSNVFRASGIAGYNRSGAGLGIGVLGQATDSPTGTGVNGFGSITGGYFEATGAPSGIYTPTGVYGAASAQGVGVKASGGVALELDGALKVSGTNKTAFRLARTLGIGTQGLTVIDNGLTNGDPNAIILVTPINVTRVITDVYYESGKWQIGCYPTDSVVSFRCPLQYNILVIKQ